MNRSPSALEHKPFDLVVIGGGIFGVCAAHDAAQRGLSVAVIDRGDFCSAASANSYKLIHGGIRYLQHGDIRRIRQSSAARRIFLRVAPHLVQPLPVVVPTYGHALQSKWAMRTAMALYEAATLDRNRGIADAGRRIPRGHCLSRKEVLDNYPGLRRQGLTGAAVFCDAQMYDPPRLVLAMLKSAVNLGAVAVNYVAATRFLVQHNRVAGVQARDMLTGSELTIRARCVLNAAGPYAERLLKDGLGYGLATPTHWSRDAYFVVPRRLLAGRRALALQATSKDPDSWLSRGGRHLFLTPWRDYTLVGVWHKVHRGHPDEYHVSDDELETFVSEINERYSGLDLTADDVSLWNAGLIPFGANDPSARDLRFGHRSRLVDHYEEHGIQGLLTLIGVRFTTGPCEAVTAVDKALVKLGKKAPRSKLHDSTVEGGDVDDFGALVRQVMAEGKTPVDRRIATALAHRHGTAYRHVLECARRQPELAETIDATDVLKAEVVHAARREMAITLADVILRRTDLGTGEYPGREVLRQCAEVLGRELGWDRQRVEREMEDVAGHYPPRVRQRKDLGAPIANAVRHEPLAGSPVAAPEGR